jgi:hypothetical protein
MIAEEQIIAIDGSWQKVRPLRVVVNSTACCNSKSKTELRVGFDVLQDT